MVERRSKADWIAALESAGVPCGPINDLGEVFEDPQVVAREMQVTVAHPLAGEVKLVRSPIKMSVTPPEVTGHPPLLGEHTEAVLQELLGVDTERLASLRAAGIV